MIDGRLFRRRRAIIPDDPDERERPVLARQQVINATAACVTRLGFHETTIDDIVRESGVSRASIYRWVGGRDALLRALLEHLAQPYLVQSNAIAMGPGSLSERIERIIAGSIESIDSIPWLKRMLNGDLFKGDLVIFSEAHKSIAGGLIRSMLEAAAETREWSPPDEIENLLEWVLRQILLLGADRYETASAIRKRVALYVMPILGLTKQVDISTNIIERLDAIEASIKSTR